MSVSIIIPTIRMNNWRTVLDSISKSCVKYHYEVIFIGPFCNLPEQNAIINDYPGTSFLYSQASPNICQQIAMSFAKCDILHVFSDDCVFMPGAIDQSLDKLHELGCDAFVPNYDEGGNCAVGNFSLNHCYAKTCTPDEFVIFNTAFMRRDKFFYLGGFDPQFETLCVAQADLAARWQFIGFSVVSDNLKLSACGHMPGTSGDHAPMHYAQLTNDIPRYVEKYKSVPSLSIDFNEYKKYPNVWKRRFE